MVCSQATKNTKSAAYDKDYILASRKKIAVGYVLILCAEHLVIQYLNIHGFRGMAG